MVRKTKLQLNERSSTELDKQMHNYKLTEWVFSKDFNPTNQRAKAQWTNSPDTNIGEQKVGGQTVQNYKLNCSENKEFGISSKIQ